MTDHSARSTLESRGTSVVTARIWIEPVKRPDGRNWYSERWGLLLRTRLGGPDGEILCDRMHNPVCESCRALQARGITGKFETSKPGIPYACLRGDIAKTAGLTIREPDSADDARPVHFTKWKPFDLDAVSHRAGLAPASEDTGPGRGGGPVDANASPRSGWNDALAEAAAVGDLNFRKGT